MFVVLFIADLY